jgi:hypothetical protein
MMSVSEDISDAKKNMKKQKSEEDKAGQIEEEIGEEEGKTEQVEKEAVNGNRQAEEEVVYEQETSWSKKTKI